MLELAKKCLEMELLGASALSKIINDNFLNICKILAKCKGKVIISGVGKSGHIGKKISSTMSSIGVPSIFLHPTEASHGDLGVISNKDILILISNSGETREFMHLLAFISTEKIISIAITRSEFSTLSNAVSHKLVIPSSPEVLSYNAPTTSTTQTLILGDMLAVCVSYLKGFSEIDYAKIHPGGKLGLSLQQISSIMRKEFASCKANAGIMEAISKMQSGFIIILQNKKLAGILTDGDIRRGILKYGDIKNYTAFELSVKNPIVLYENEPIIKAVELFNETKIGSIIILSKPGEVVGIIDRKDIEF